MIRPDELADDELLRRMGAGDHAAFLAVYRRCQGPIYRFVLHMSGSPAVAEDVTQEVFTMLIEGRSHFDASRGKLQAYLIGIGRNLALRRFEKDHAFLPLADGEGPSPNGIVAKPHAALVIDPPDHARAQAIARVRRAILSLPTNYREVVVLCDLEEMSYDDASALLECAIGTVRSRLHRGRSLLADKLRDLREPAQRSSMGGTK